MNRYPKERKEKASEEMFALTARNSDAGEDTNEAIRISRNASNTESVLGKKPKSKAQEIGAKENTDEVRKKKKKKKTKAPIEDYAGRLPQKETINLSTPHFSIDSDPSMTASDRSRSSSRSSSPRRGRSRRIANSLERSTRADPPGFADRKPSRHQNDQPPPPKPRTKNIKNQKDHPPKVDSHNPRPSIIKKQKDTAVAFGIPLPTPCDIEQSSFHQSYSSNLKDKSFRDDDELGSSVSTTSTRHTSMASSPRYSAIISPPPTTQTNPGDDPSGILSSLRIGHRARKIIRELLKYKMIKVLQVLLAFYVGFLTYADIGPPGGLRDTATGLIIDQASEERTENGLILVNGSERPIVAATAFQVVCIGITRMSAFFMYPALVLVYVSKLRATTSFLSRTPLAMFMYGDVHELHVYCGWTIMIFSLIHTVFHLARWAQQGNLHLLFTHISGVTGLIIILSCILICIPMTIFREQIRYEIRKKMHYLFLLFAFALCFHTPTSAIPNGGFTAWVFGTILGWYFLDGAYCYFFMTEKIDTTKFHVLPSGVRMTMTVSKHFQKMGQQGGYCYICLPWVDKNQWHAFSLFENPSNPAEREIFMMKLGDWTNQVHTVLQRDTVRPAWIHGPFPSPYNSAEEYDNQILVASGIGITPALSVIRAHRDSRRINLIWAVREKCLLEFFLHHLYLDHQGWNLIYYTGKEKLKESDMKEFTNTNVCIITGRPNLKDVIPNIIYGIESGLGLPERYNHDGKMVASEMLVDLLDDSSDEEEHSISAQNRQAEFLSSYASELGFHLSSHIISQELQASQEMSSFELPEPFIPQRRRASEAIMGHLSLGFRPWIKQDEAKEFVKNLDKKLVLPTWGILYCGGKKMEKDVRKVADECELHIHTESFAW